MRPIALKVNLLTLKQVIIVTLRNTQELLNFKEMTPTGENTANDYTNSLLT